MDIEEDANIKSHAAKVDKGVLYLAHIKELSLRLPDGLPIRSVAIHGEIEFSTNDKKVTKKIHVVVPIDIDEWETEE